MKCTDFMWPDRSLEKIEIEFDTVEIKVLNDYLNKIVIIKCSNCTGISRILTWDETIIENINVKYTNISDNNILQEIKSLYQTDALYSSKSFQDIFYNLEIRLIDIINSNIPEMQYSCMLEFYF